jgi:hypothetical protein
MSRYLKGVSGVDTVDGWFVRNWDGQVNEDMRLGVCVGSNGCDIIKIMRFEDWIEVGVACADVADCLVNYFS